VTTVPEIHPDWDAEKATAHLADLRAQADRAEAIADAFQQAADEHYHEAATRAAQIQHCEQMFAKARGVAATKVTPTTTEPEGGER
jgi:hypothetical protein